MIDKEVLCAQFEETYVVRGEHGRIIGAYDTLPEANSHAKGNGEWGTDANVDVEQILRVELTNGDLYVFPLKNPSAYFVEPSEGTKLGGILSKLTTEEQAFLRARMCREEP